MFNRLLYKNLEEWREKRNRKPLILRGARQVGKTTLVEMFSKNFDQYIYLNLDNAEET
jgi:predicted AAA+ superfamily ATPase